jgi:hypothetical protein
VERLLVRRKAGLGTYQKLKKSLTSFSLVWEEIFSTWTVVAMIAR